VKDIDVDKEMSMNEKNEKSMNKGEDCKRKKKKKISVKKLYKN